MSARGRDIPAAPALVLVSAIGLALRIPSFADSLNGDELATYFVVTGHDLGRVIDIVQSPQEVTPPLYPIIAALTQGLGDSLNSLRWVSLVAGVAAIPLTYLLGVRTIGRAPALVGAAIMALSPFMIFYATEARAYALMMVLCLGSTLALLQAVDTPRKRWWGAYAVLSCAAMYTHYTAGFVLAGQALWALFSCSREWKWIVGANVTAALAYVPWLSSYQADQDSPGAQIIGTLQPFGLGAFKTDVLHWAVSHPDISFSVRQMPGKPALALLGIAVAGALAVAGAEAARRRRIPRPARGVVLVFVLAAATPVLAGLYSSVGVSVFLPRNLIASSPGLALVLGLIVTAPRRRAVSIACSVLVLAGFAIGGVKLRNAEGQRADYKAVARFIEARGGPDAIVVDVPGLSPGPLSQLDAAAAPGQPFPRKPTILRLSRPSRAAQLSASRPGGPGQFANLPIPTPRDIARQAVREARGSRTIFLVSPGEFEIEQSPEGVSQTGAPDQPSRPTLGGLLAAGTPLSDFLAALPPGFRATETRTFPGTFGVGKVTVYVLRRARDAR